MSDVEAESLEHRNFVYEFTRAEFDKEAARWESTEKKATNFTPVLGILLGASGFFAKWVIEENILPPRSWLDAFIVALVVLVFMANIVSWVFVFCALGIRKFHLSSLLGDDLVEWLLNRDINSIQGKCALRFARDAQENRKTVNRKAGWLIWGYYGIFITAFLLVLMLVLTGYHNWASNHLIADWGSSLFFLE